MIKREKLQKILTGSKTRVAITGLLVLALVAVIDYDTDFELAFSLFYLAPISITAWYGGKRLGCVFSIISALLWLLNDYWLIEHFYASPLAPYWNASIQLAFFLVTTLLISKIKNYVVKITEISRLKSDMTHIVSHEFNNALTNISLCTSLLHETEPESKTESREKLYSTLSETVKILVLYVKNILNAAKMEKEKLKLHKVSLSPDDLINEALLLVDNSVKIKNIDFAAEIKDKKIKIMADREAIFIVISNLVGNAVKYTPRNGKIKMIFDFQDISKKVLFKIENNGIGISKSDMIKIKKGFYRTEKGKALAEGFGLGIKISSEILLLHGSNLEIQSEPGKGTAMSFLIDAA